MEKTPLTAISGIGPATAARLEAAGIASAEALIAAPPELLAGLPGFVPARAERVLAAARNLIATPAPADDGSGGKKRKKKSKGPKSATGKDDDTKKKKKHGKKKAKEKRKKGKRKDERKREKVKGKKKSKK